jgi:Molecular chaperone GrpE (heat shock protein)
MSKEKDENITDDIHSESETDELEESNEVSDEERIAELKDTILKLRTELDNSQKRSVAEVGKAHKYGVERMRLEIIACC